MRLRRKIRIGKVISAKMEKTIVVEITRVSKHPVYKKMVKSTNKFKVHDEKKVAKVGDKVRIMETRPISKEKHWTLVEILNKELSQK
ncbi:MAG: 30S ribosomal protein S17 [Candidatus Omnitrophota bacterium]